MTLNQEHRTPNMNTASRLIALVSASLLVSFANIAPVQAAAKPCCTNNGDYFNSTSKTCRRNGGTIVNQRYCQGRWQGQRHHDNSSFSITLGNVVIGYSDGYYDNNRQWHGWRNDNERNWYQQNRRDSYYHQRRASDRNQNRRDWREGKRKDWR